MSILIWVIMLCSLQGCEWFKSHNASDTEALWDPASLDGKLPELAQPEALVHSSEALVYFDRYQLHSPGISHRFGTFRSGSYQLVGHLFSPERARATVFLFHGYLDHSGTHSAFIHHLLDQGYAVAVYDLPGHGLSSGRRADIEHFDHYTASQEAFMTLARRFLPGPYHAVSHSTGAAILITHLLTTPDSELDQVVLVAPLVRSAMWNISNVMADLFDPVIDDIPRMPRANSSDPDFLDFTRNDPLQPGTAGIDWVQALDDWHEELDAFAPVQRPIVIIQGDIDAIIDWEYNLDYLRQKFPQARVEMIEGGRHQLLGEAQALRQQVIAIIDETLSAASPAR